MICSNVRKAKREKNALPYGYRMDYKGEKKKTFNMNHHVNLTLLLRTLLTITIYYISIIIMLLICLAFLEFI